MYELEYHNSDIPIHTSAFAFIGNIGKFGSGGKTAHFHNCMEIGYCYEGSGIGLIEDKEVAYKQGDICVIAPDTIHVFDAQEGMISKWEWIMADTCAARRKV